MKNLNKTIFQNLQKVYKESDKIVEDWRNE